MTTATSQIPHDYRAPEYLISDIDLTFDPGYLQNRRDGGESGDAPRCDRAAASRWRRPGRWSPAYCIENRSDYKEEGNQLVIDNLLERFTLRIVNEIPALQPTRRWKGFYQSGGLCTQCEAEGFRHITGIWTARTSGVFTTKIIADKTLYPFLVSKR